MLEYLLSLERDLFLAINSFHTPFLDVTMMIYTGITAWIPFIIFFLIMLIYRKPARDWLPVIVALLGVVLLGYLVSGLIFKPFFERFRPTFHPDFMEVVKTVNNYLGEGLYGFISGHSTFSFSMAMFTSLLFRYKPYTIVIFVWAFIMVYSRIYLGVHFLTDVIPGIIVGTLVGWFSYYMYVRVVTKDTLVNENIFTPFGYPNSTKKIITLVLAGNIFFLFFLGIVLS